MKILISEEQLKQLTKYINKLGDSSLNEAMFYTGAYGEGGYGKTLEKLYYEANVERLMRQPISQGGLDSWGDLYKASISPTYKSTVTSNTLDFYTKDIFRKPANLKDFDFDDVFSRRNQWSDELLSFDELAYFISQSPEVSFKLIKYLQVGAFEKFIRYAKSERAYQEDKYGE